jgi:ubiquinone/menaquinone biosynthesis C-methylase UbiE
MNYHTHNATEALAAEAFNRQAPLFDERYNMDAIIQYKRKRVRDHLALFLKPCSHILELNSGTGEDAIFLARQGHSVHATDISALMQEVLIEKVKYNDLQSAITAETCSFTGLDHLENRGPFDCIFSNFAGLNCTDQLEKVLASLDNLLKPGGIATLVILPEFCLWEFLLLFKGKFKTAFRRFAGSKGARAHIENQVFRCWYYNPSFIKKRLPATFSIEQTEGLCTIVPPSYLEGFAEKYPRIFQVLKTKEEKLKLQWPWRAIGDYFIITLKKS